MLCVSRGRCQSEVEVGGEWNHHFSSVDRELGAADCSGVTHSHPRPRWNRPPGELGFDCQGKNRRTGVQWGLSCRRCAGGLGADRVPAQHGVTGQPQGLLTLELADCVGRLSRPRS